MALLNTEVSKTLKRPSHANTKIKRFVFGSKNVLSSPKSHTHVYNLNQVERSRQKSLMGLARAVLRDLRAFKSFVLSFLIEVYRRRKLFHQSFS